MFLERKVESDLFMVKQDLMTKGHIFQCVEKKNGYKI